MKTITAQFGSRTGQYDYLVPEGDEPKVGDLIVTSVDWGDPDYDFAAGDRTFVNRFADGCRVAVVRAVHEDRTRNASKFYLHRISLQGLKDSVETNRSAVQREKARAEAMRELDKLLAGEARMVLFRQLAETNPRAKELLAQIDA
jgi:hypothetical protein